MPEPLDEGRVGAMKAAFVATEAAVLNRVYGPKQRAALGEREELLPGVYADIRSEDLRGVEAIFSTWGMPVCTEEAIRECMPDLKYLFYAAGTVQSFARPFLNCGVRVFSAWQANAVPVVQYTFAQIVLALKGYFAVQPLTRRNRAAARECFAHYPGVFDAKVGLLGCGAIGSRLAEMLKQLDVEVWAYDPFLSDERAKQLNVRRADLSEVFAQCDVVSNHLANLPATVGIIKREHLLSMKPYSTFINTGRGPQLDEADLYDMLVQDETRCALIDVMTDEENSDDNPLNGLPNCFITPHIAGSGGNEVRRMADYMIETLDKVKNGEASDYEVTLKMLDTMA